MTLVEWLSENHPIILEVWRDSFTCLIDLDTWLEKFYDWIYQEFQAYLDEID